MDAVAKENARKIDEYLRNEKKQYLKQQKDPKVLLLGSSDSGKSTLLKQFKILHKGGFEKDELMKARFVIILNAGAVLGMALRSTAPAIKLLKEVLLINSNMKICMKLDWKYCQSMMKQKEP